MEVGKQRMCSTNTELSGLVRIQCVHPVVEPALLTELQNKSFLNLCQKSLKMSQI